MAGRQITNRSFVDLKISSGHDPGANVLIDGSQPIRSQSHPAGHALTWQVDSVAFLKNGLLPVERKMIAILAYDDLCQTSGSTPCLLSTPSHGDAVGTVFGAEPSNCTGGTSPKPASLAARQAFGGNSGSTPQGWQANENPNNKEPAGLQL